MECKIKEMTNDELEDFKKVYSVFSEAPYFEKYTDEEIKEIFTEYLENGNVYGAYFEENCVGLVALERGAKEEHPVKFENENVMYLADVAVLANCRNKRIGSQLMLYGVMQAKKMGFDKLYMRTLKKGSMSIQIARRIGFTDIQGIIQSVDRERTNGLKVSMDNVFLEIDLNELNKDKLRQELKPDKSLEERGDMSR